MHYWPSLVDLNHVKLNYLLMINLERCNTSYNTGDDSSAKICVPNKTKNFNVKEFNII